MKKAITLILAVLLIVGCSVGGTLAWLTATTGPVTNTFTYGDINIDLWENTYNQDKNELNNDITREGVTNYKIIPGVNLPKNPTVKVEAGSEDCYLFVKVEEENWPAFTETVTGDITVRKVNYAVAGGWNVLAGHDNVYFRTVAADAAEREFAVLMNNQVTVSENLTKGEVTDIETVPTLKFTAYAVQMDGIADAATAWGKVSG